MNTNNLVYQFKITLGDILPAIWRRIQVPMNYSFWDLHVALQDSMGWLDYHLHMFRFRKPHKRAAVEIGIPGDEMDVLLDRQNRCNYNVITTFSREAFRESTHCKDR